VKKNTINVKRKRINAKTEKTNAKKSIKIRNGDATKSTAI
jgi:hypothetical protein